MHLLGEIESSLEFRLISHLAMHLPELIVEKTQACHNDSLLPSQFLQSCHARSLSFLRGPSLSTCQPIRPLSLSQVCLTGSRIWSTIESRNSGRIDLTLDDSQLHAQSPKCVLDVGFLLFEQIHIGHTGLHFNHRGEAAVSVLEALPRAEYPMLRFVALLHWPSACGCPPLCSPARPAAWPPVFVSIVGWFHDGFFCMHGP